jgi:hypothetical protein
MTTSFALICILRAYPLVDVKSASAPASAPPTIEDIGNQLYDMLIKNNENSTTNKWVDIVSKLNLSMTLLLPPMNNEIITDK